MLAKLALKNIKRSIKDYAIYFFTLVLGVAIFYVFNALDSQSIMLDVSDRVRDMMELVSVIMGIVSVFVAFILGALIIYASRFLIKRRSKEFGIYLTLGMSKRKISLILLIETIFIGFLSLAVGLLLGIVASQFASVLVANMFDANMTNFHFVFSASALIQTLIYFGIIYVVVMIFNTIVVSRQKLINLLSSSRRNEKIKNKNLWVCTVVFIIAAIILGYAYYLVTAGLENLVMDSDGPGILIVPILMGVVATFMLFWSLSGILLRIIMSFKKVYYNKLNAFVLRQFSSKINTTVASMSVICLMIFFTICILGSALSINQTLHQSLETALPMDAQVESMGDDAPSIPEIYKQENINIDELLTDIQSYDTYMTEGYFISGVTGNLINFDDLSTDTIEITDGEATVEEVISTKTFVHLSDYNRMAKIFQLPELELAKDEYAVLSDLRPMIEYMNKILEHDAQLKIGNATLKPKTDKCINGTIELAMNGMNYGTFIVPDDLKITGEHLYRKEYLLGNFADPEQAEEIERKLGSINNRFYSNGNASDDESGIYYYSVNTRQEIIDNSVGTSAMVTFIGLYLGIIFLISSAAVLALKELSESSDNRSKYSILRKIGASESMLSRALFWQIFIFFLFPLLVAILHSVFGLMFCDFILSTIGGVDIAHSLPGVALILAVIYGGYFIITYLCSKNIIREHR